MVKVFGFSFLEPEPVSFWKGVLNAIPKVHKPVPASTVRDVPKMVKYAAGGLAAAFVLYKARHQVKKCIPGWQRLKTALGFEPPVTLREEGFKTCFESTRSGSEEQTLLAPKNQILVGDMIAGEFRAAGCGVRIANWIVMPSHVFAACEAPCLKGRQHWIKLSSNLDYVDLDTDLIAIRLTERELSTIGVSVCSISHCLPYTGDFVQITGAAGKGTMGALRHDRYVFGRVVYDGTTVAGYSGAAYVSGNRLVGIHTNGGATNGGYSASYVLSLLNAIDRIKPEDSEDWLRSQFQKNKNRVRYDQRYHDLDEVRVEVGGRYAVVSRDSMARAFGKDWATELSGLDGLSNPSYEGESCKKDQSSGEASDSKSGASSTSENSPDQFTREMAFITHLLTNMSVKRLDALRKLVTTGGNSNSQESVVGEASTSKSTA